LRVMRKIKNKTVGGLVWTDPQLFC
jgi:hypothetical protein